MDKSMKNELKTDINVEYQEKKFLNLVSDIGISEIKNKDIFIQAITFTSYYNENNKKHVLFGENRVIALIGDCILKSVLSIQMYDSDRYIKSGKLTSDKSKMERNQKLNGIGAKLELKEMFLHSNTDMDNDGIARGVEAIIGYIHMSYGIQKASKFIKSYII